MKTAIVYYSLQGNIRYVAEKVASGTGADLIELVPVKAYPDKGMIKFIWGGSAVTFKKKPNCSLISSRPPITTSSFSRLRSGPAALLRRSGLSLKTTI